MVVTTSVVTIMFLQSVRERPKLTNVLLTLKWRIQATTVTLYANVTLYLHEGTFVNAMKLHHLIVDLLDFVNFLYITGICLKKIKSNCLFYVKLLKNIFSC